MSVDKDFVLAALLQHNFLPAQSPDCEELPPILSSRSFSVKAARKLAASSGHRPKGYEGYDAVEYRLTRFNGVSRCCSIPHPTAYAKLALRIYEYWDKKLHFIADNEHSVIRPRHHSDGRIIIMDDYGTESTKASRNLTDSFGRRFFVRTDISNCFPSIYSHTIPWALVGMKTAKLNRDPNEWFNQLDEKTRKLKRNETQGVAIGPATSNIIFEAILSKVDEAMDKKFKADKGLVFRRFIDDYTAYCKTEEQAQRFIRVLAENLAFYKLALNIAKTVVMPLPQSLDSDWVTELSLAVPRDKNVPAIDAVRYLDLAVRLAPQQPDGSVLKYALKSLCGQKLAPAAVQTVLEYALTLSFYQPVLLPVLELLFDATTCPGKFAYGDELRRIVRENADSRRSDGAAWGLYYLMKYGAKIESETADTVLAEPDCIALLLLYVQGNKSLKARVVEYAESLDHSDLYELDQYWLLLYELFRDGGIGNPYAGDRAFQILKDQGVSFVLQKGTGF